MLRTRLFLNLLPFVVILLAVGVYAIVLFSRITANVDLTVTGNYRSVRAAEQMKLTLSRMEGAALLYINFSSKRIGTEYFETNRMLFEENLAVQLHNTKSPLETGLDNQLVSNY